MAGRSIVGPFGSGTELVEPVRTLAAASTYTLAVPAEKYRHIYLYGSVNGGMTAGFANGVLLTCNGVVAASSYSWFGARCTNTGGAPGVFQDSSGSVALTTAFLVAVTASAPATDVNFTIKIDPLVGRARAIEAHFESRGAAAASDIYGDQSGWYLDTSTLLTSIGLAFGSSATGFVEAVGVLA